MPEPSGPGRFFKDLMKVAAEPPDRVRTRVGTGILLILTGLSLLPAYVAFAVELPFLVLLPAAGSSNPALLYVEVASPFFLGPTLFVLSGVATITALPVRLPWLVASGVAGVLALTIWAFSTLGVRGSELSPQFFAEACAAAVAAGIVVTYFLKRAWLGALIAAVLAVPVLLRDVAWVRPMLEGPGTHFALDFMALSAFAAPLLWVASLVCTILFRFR